MILGLFTLLAAEGWAQDAVAPEAPTAPQATLLIQSWITAWDQDQKRQSDPSGYGDPEDDPGFKMRRVRAGFVGEDGGLHYGVMFGMAAPADGILGGDGTLEVVDAYGGWDVHRHLGLTAGVQKVPFGREALISASDLVFQERSIASNHLTPGRELGLVASLGPEFLDVSIGAFNGNHSILGDDNAGLLLAARAQYDRALGEAVLSMGVNGVYDAGLATEEKGIGVDLEVLLGSVSILAEGITLSIEPTHTDVTSPAVLGSTQRLGGHLQVGYTVGQWEPAVRLEYFDDDVDADDNGDLLQTLVGMTGHFAEDRVRAGAGWVHREELEGKSLPNDTARIWLQFHY
ncbi:MAG: porin [Myxococcota bacterium]|nr:porin [Myxococcota bacterium]